ncbi:MAG TPA: MFS transporter [Streptosporangiaceae bacterium]|nr:MFS transporter [Streptosporangiaceae bacterium]
MGADNARAASDDPFGALDESTVNRFQWKIMFVSGMGFFTDAYDLFVIGIVVALLHTEWHLSTTQVSLLNSVTLATSAVGALVFGRVADMLGRKRIYGYEVLILAAAALASALAPNYVFLLVCRAILGIGIGGDYPVSATIMSEYSGKKSRGRMVGLVFAMQGAGLVVGPLIASILLASGISTQASWRILLGLGAIPGLAVFYLRRRIHETPRFAMAGGAHDEAHAAIAQATGGKPALGPAPESAARMPQGIFDGFRTLGKHRRLLLWLVGTAGAWFLLDFCYYGNTISTPEILKLLNPHASLLHNTVVQLVIFVVFAVPGYIVAILLMDRTGRKSIQISGFAMMGLMFLLIGLIPGITTNAIPFVVFYGISYFFTQFGPNTTTFIYPAEIFPVEVRTTGHGLSAAAGKIGAFAGAYLFPVMLASSSGIRIAEVVAGLVSLAGLALTAALLPEPNGKSLEELSAQAYMPHDVAVGRS